VAVIDVLMPTMSGIECARLLPRALPKARVILISGSIFKTSDLTQTSAEETPTWKERSSRTATRDDPGARGRNNRRTAQPNQRLTEAATARSPLAVLHAPVYAGE